MRLKQIKLAGFKSFVDPTTVNLPSNRCAVVGPNGCGKSNIIDAVRWVMGESSAKQLRGENLTDVIFNGSNARQPTAQASIELVFDNSDGRIGGEYAAYAEIAIRRQVTREAQSTYFLNGQKCRRRDILDIFLGTGFGPRSYSIIEQGMISQLVEAKPEELRVYLEEAAGISKYKERRRETENRIKHTRENLSRINDIREELGKQLERLNRQARAAEQYQGLKAEERKLAAELASLKLATVATGLDAAEAAVREAEVALEKTQSERSRLVAETENKRREHADHSDRFSSVQGHFYKLGADIARTEEAIAFNAERVEQLELDLATVSERRAEAERQLNEDSSQISEFEEALVTLQPDLTAAANKDAEQGEALSKLEAAYADWQRGWDSFASEVASAERTTSVAGARIDYLQQLLERLQHRATTLEQDAEALPATDGSTVDSLASAVASQEAQVRAAEDAVEAQLRALVENRETMLSAEAQLEEARNAVQTLRHEHAALHARQQAALGKDDQAAQSWIESAGLANAARLGERLAVVAGWERAVESVLGAYLQALEVERLDDLAAELPRLEAGSVALVERAGNAAPLVARDDVGLPLLSSLIRQGTQESGNRLELGSLLTGVYAANSLDAALAARARLAPGESVVTREGIWLGRDWARAGSDGDNETSILELGLELEATTVRLEEAEQRLADAQRHVLECRNRQEQLEAARDAQQREVRSQTEALAALRTDHGVQVVQQEQTTERRARLIAEREELAGQLAHEQQQLEEARATLSSAQEAEQALAGQRGERQAERERLTGALEEARETARASRDSFHRIDLERQRLDSGLNAARAAQERLRRQLTDFDEQRTQLQASINASRQPLPELRQDLDGKLSERTTVEKELAGIRNDLDAAEAAVRELDTESAAAEQRLDSARGAVETARLERQGLLVSRNNLQEQLDAALAAAELTLDTLRAEIPDEATIDGWEEALAKLDRKIQRLGPINLAAIDEYKSEQERKAYLDQQNDDLEEALETLLGAIRKIDKETRQLFKETFETVNTRLGELFPKVFGGGHASLELTGEDLLDTGVSLMARPPGKRNASIHLLSGGEKAMTAVALIFAIFHLNPSPVCLLDEVDAPLDDSNTTRFAELIKEMSADVQFVVITHNKITMEMADHLMGVTMQEAGVSRLVSVDVEEAAAMAAS